MSPTIAEPQQHKPNDYASDQEVRWCPGCGDYSILAQAKKALSELNLDPDKIAIISGIGCSSRFPYYLNTYGIHGIHGRAPALASGLKLARPDITTIVVTGDGDGFSIGGNHMIHAMRRNSDVKILLFNNRIYGLTKGQYSPTSELGKVSPSTPYGSVDAPIGPLSIALACEATFIARTVDVFPKHLTRTIARAIAHKGVAFVEIYQNCNIFNDNAYEYLTGRGNREERVLELEHGQPLLFGADKRKGIRLNDMGPEIVTLGGNGNTPADIVVHDEKAAEPSLAFCLSRMRYPEFPEPIGVFRDIDRPTYGELVRRQIDEVTQRKGPGKLQELLAGRDTWTIE